MLKARVSRGRTSVHVTQFVTSSHVTILLVTRVRGVRRYCFALCVDVRLYQQDSVMFTLVARIHVRTYRIRCPSWLDRRAAQMQFQRFRRATAKSRAAATSQKCTSGPSNTAVFNGVSILRDFTVSNVNLHDLLE